MVGGSFLVVDLFGSLLSVERVPFVFGLERGVIGQCCRARLITRALRLGLVGAGFPRLGGRRILALNLGS